MFLSLEFGCTGGKSWMRRLRRSKTFAHCCRQWLLISCRILAGSARHHWQQWQWRMATDSCRCLLGTCKITFLIRVWLKKKKIVGLTNVLNFSWKLLSFSFRMDLISMPRLKIMKPLTVWFKWSNFLSRNGTNRNLNHRHLRRSRNESEDRRFAEWARKSSPRW